jgi:Mg2+-importing ATPase
VAIACILPFTPIGSLFGFIPLPASFFVVLAGLVISYLIIVELVKRWFYRKYASTTDGKTT